MPRGAARGAERAGASPLVSVVIPTARGGTLLGEAVESALRQTVQDVEVLVVRNAPGVDVSCLAPDSRVRLVDEPIPGRAFAVNRGAFEAHGRWLALLDDDDAWAPEKLERQLQALDGWDGVAASVTNYVRVDEDGNVVKGGISRRADFDELISYRTGYLPSTLLVDRELFSVIGGMNSTYRSADDLDMFLRLATLGRIAFVDGPMLRYRVHAGSMNRTTPAVVWLEGARVISDARRAAVLRGDWKTWRHSWRATILMRRWCASDAMAFADQLRRERRFGPAARQVALALRASPLDVVRLALKRLAGRV